MAIESVASQHPEPPAAVLYSDFSHVQKTCIAFLASFSAMFSGLSSFIYYPGVTAMAKSLGCSVELINLTITSYQIVSGIAPSILGDLADQSGRRPVSLLAFTLYFTANIGLALQNDYIALMFLRCLQSAGSSSTIAIAYGFIADIAPPSERGSYVGILQGFTNSAPSIGPILGGVLTQEASWRWIFWTLSILSGLNLAVLFLFMPETSRKLVGRGTLPPPRRINIPALSALRPKSSLQTGSAVATEKLRLRWPNPLTSLKSLRQRASFLVILVGGIQYTIYGCIATSLSSQMIRIYSLSYLTGGLVYIPAGVGGMIAAFATGKLLDRDFARVALRHSLPLDRSSNDLTRFPIEEARLLSVFPLLLISFATTVGFGWALQCHASLAVPLVLIFFGAMAQVAIFTVCGTLLTDLNPDRSATIQAGYNLVRCTLSAAGIAGLQRAIDGLGAGWTFTIYGVVGAVCVPILAALRRWGMAWRTVVKDQAEHEDVELRKAREDGAT